MVCVQVTTWLAQDSHIPRDAVLAQYNLPWSLASTHCHLLVVSWWANMAGLPPTHVASPTQVADLLLTAFCQNLAVACRFAPPDR